MASVRSRQKDAVLSDFDNHSQFTIEFIVNCASTPKSRFVTGMVVNEISKRIAERRKKLDQDAESKLRKGLKIRTIKRQSYKPQSKVKRFQSLTMRQLSFTI